jgi:hypothetical protein
MGTLKPGASYIYERADGVVYAREVGTTERQPIGWDSGKDPDTEYQRIVDESVSWREILTAAKTNPALQKALDRAILIYQTIKEEHNE